MGKIYGKSKVGRLSLILVVKDHPSLLVFSFIVTMAEILHESMDPLTLTETPPNCSADVVGEERRVSTSSLFTDTDRDGSEASSMTYSHGELVAAAELLERLTLDMETSKRRSNIAIFKKTDSAYSIGGAESNDAETKTRLLKLVHSTMKCTHPFFHFNIIIFNI
jgi:hypothetical protein